MKRKEAIQILSTRDAHGVLCGYTSGVTEALDMAIEALSREQEKYVDGFPSADTVSREDYVDIIKDYRKQYENMNNEIADLEAKLSADEQIQDMVEKRVAELVHLNYELEQQLADVVRCKDCDRKLGSTECPCCTKEYHINEETFYCAWGERKAE